MRCAYIGHFIDDLNSPTDFAQPRVSRSTTIVDKACPRGSRVIVDSRVKTPGDISSPSSLSFGSTQHFDKRIGEKRATIACDPRADCAAFIASGAHFWL